MPEPTPPRPPAPWPDDEVFQPGWHLTVVAVIAGGLLLIYLGLVMWL